MRSACERPSHRSHGLARSLRLSELSMGVQQKAASKLPMQERRRGMLGQVHAHFACALSTSLCIARARTICTRSTLAHLERTHFSRLPLCAPLNVTPRFPSCAQIHSDFVFGKCEVTTFSRRGPYRTRCICSTRNESLGDVPAVGSGRRTRTPHCRPGFIVMRCLPGGAQISHLVACDRRSLSKIRVRELLRRPIKTDPFFVSCHTYGCNKPPGDPR